MKWILAGKNDAAVECLELLVEHGDEVFVLGVADDDGQDGWQRSLRGAAERLDVRCDQPRRINAPEVIEELADFGADALFSIQYDQILRDALFDRIGCPCLNLHFALLPRHRGVAPIAWALIAGDRSAGVTLHHMIADIDAGDVIAQRAVPITPEQTARELYDALSVACVELFRASYPFSAELLSRRRGQDAAVAIYHKHGELDFSQRDVDWSRPASELQNWIRAMIFPPMQYPRTGHDGRPLEVTRVAPSEPDGAEGGVRPGTVLASAPDGLLVATSAGSLRLTGLADPSRPAADTSTITRAIAVGDRLS